MENVKVSSYNKLTQIREKNIFFILSTGRSGTQTFARILSKLPDCVCMHEPAPQLILESSDYRYGRLDCERLKQYILQTRSPAINGKVYGESNQTLSLMVPILATSFAKAKFVWLIRNGLDVVSSIFSRQWYTGHSANHDRYEDCPPLEKAWIDGRIMGDLCGDVPFAKWKSMNPFARCCWYWTYINRTIEKDLRDMASAGSYRKIKLEELDCDLPELVEWLGFGQAPDLKSRNHNRAHYNLYPWQKWTPEEKKTFLYWCGPLMDRLYPDWRSLNRGFFNDLYDAPDCIISPEGKNLKNLTNLQVNNSVKTNLEDHNIYYTPQIKSLPKISVYIPSYNQREYLVEAIESVLAQTLNPHQVIIVDDFSNDGSQELIAKYAKKYPNLVFPIYHMKNFGVVQTRIDALNAVTGDYVTYVDGDDRFLPEKLEREFDILTGNTNAQIAYSNNYYINPEGQRTGVWSEEEKPPEGNIFKETFSRCFPKSSLFRMELVNYQAWKSVGFHDPDITIYEDFDMRIRLTKHFRVAFCDEPLSEIRLHDKGLSKLKAKQHLASLEFIYHKNRSLLADLNASDQKIVKKGFNDFVNKISLSAANQLAEDRKIKKQYSDEPSNEMISERSNRGRPNRQNELGANLIFLISQPRAGSTLFQRLLAGHPEIHTTAEPWVMLHPLYALKENGIKAEYRADLAQQGLADFLMQVPEGIELYKRALRKFSTTLYNRILELSGKRFFLDKTPRYFHIIPGLFSIFPEANFIFLLRNPVAVLSSVLKTWFGNCVDDLQIENLIDLVKGPVCLLDGIKKLKEKAIVVEYESLVKSPEELMLRVCNRIGIPYYKDMLEYGRRPKPKGKFGDPVGIFKHKRPVTDNIDIWQNNISSLEFVEISNQYLETLGSDIVSKMGYNFKELKQKLNSQSRFSNTVKTKFNEVEALNKKGENLFAKGKFDDARGFLNRIIELDPSNVEAQHGLHQLKCGKKDRSSEDNNSESFVTDKNSSYYNQSMVQRYFQPPAGNTEKYISLKPIKILDGLISSNDCLKDYNIHEFGKGFKAAEFILQHIVVNKLDGSFQIKTDIWHKTVAVKLECEILSAKNGQPFSELKPNTAEDIDPDFAVTEGPSRLADISAYAERFSKGEDVDPPLYVTGAVLNNVGAKIDPKMIFMMDGARRISAAALMHRPKIIIYLLLLEIEYAKLIKQLHLEYLANQIRQINWFDSYQTIPLVGLQGQRSLKRFDLIDMSSLQDHTVMDFGCNLGQSCIKAVQAGAKEVIGIEGMKDTYGVACEIGTTIGFSNLHFLNVDFNDLNFNEQIDEYYPHKVDFSFFLSVYRTKELTQREKLFHYIINKTKKGIFFEGHAHSKIDTIEYYDWLFECNKLKYKFLGYSEGNLRPLFFCPIESHSSYQQITPRMIETSARGRKGIPDDESFTVSAIISTYESEKFIESKIQDLLNQTIGDQLEIIIIDSNSPENEKVIATKYAQDHKNIKYIRTEKRESIYKAWNRGIKEARGKYITNANTDDRLRPDAFEILVKELDRNSNVALAYGDFFITNYGNQEFYNHICCGHSIKPDYAPNIMLSGCHMGPQPMWRKYVHDEIGYFDESLESAGDYEFWCRLSTHYPMQHINRFLGLYYHNPAGIVNSNQNKNNHETDLVKEKYKDKFPPPSGKTSTGYYYKEHVSFGSDVNICMVTFNRLDFTRLAIDSILKNTRYPHVITVVDNNSQDGTKEYLAEIKHEGIIKNLILLDENIGVAKASNLAWQQEPDAVYYLKYDNDIVIQKPDWLVNLVKVAECIPELGAIGYNFEPTSYALESVNGHKIRIKKDANIGGACYLVPKRVEEKLGYWCEDYGLYGEEDGDYSLRLRLAGYSNAYMEDENVGIHLPGGKAALIDTVSKRGISSQEIEKEYEYRTWKDSRRQELQKPGGILLRNVEAYHNGIRSLYVPRGEFQGKLGPNVQVFRQNGFFSFLPVSGRIGQSDMEQIYQWLHENNLDDSKIEKYNENGIDSLRAIRALSTTDLDQQLKNSFELPSLTGTPSQENDRSRSNLIKTSTTAAAITASIIIPVYNQWKFTQNCLKALYEVSDIQVEFEVIVVDNASTDNTQPFLEEAAPKYPGLRFIRNKSNLGFARACNQGADHSKGYYLVFLNNDTLPQTGWLDAMIKTAEKDPLVGLVGSRLLYPDGTIQHAGVYFNEHGIPYHAFRSLPGDHADVLVTRETPGVTGACMLMPRQLYQHIGGFNEDYHMYVEDVDLCLRTWDAGFKVVYCAESVLTHFESASITDVNRRDAQVREAWSHLHKNWRDKWPTILQQFAPEETSRKIDMNFRRSNNDNARKELKVLWHAPIFDPSGYADEARNFIFQLQKQKIRPAVREIGRRSEVFRGGLDEKSRNRLDEAIAQETPEDFISVVQFPAYAFERIPQAGYHIGRTTFETDGLAADWVQKCNLMDEIWVPSEFNMQTFKAAGVTSKLSKIPEGVDSERFRPDLDALDIPGTRGMIFLSIFEWIYRKGWDVLLESWAKAFGPDDDVSLVLRTYPMNAIDSNEAKQQIEDRINHFLKNELKISRQDVAPIIVLTDQLHDGDMPHLYASADAYVLPSRGEGWGRTQMEAMACGLPVLSTRWGGNLEFMNDHNSLLIDINGLAVIDERAEISFYRGQKWAEPSTEHLCMLLLEVVENSIEMEDIRWRARLDIERYWGWEKIAGIVAKRLQEIEFELKHPGAKTDISDDTCRVRWEGSQFVNHSLALVNRELCIELAKRKDIELSLIPYEPDEFGVGEDPERFGPIADRLNSTLSTAADFHVRHQWPPNFTPPREGHWIIIQPWEFGALPKDWVEPMETLVDELWVPSNHVRDVYINSGISPDKVFVVPNGVNYDQFYPGITKFPLDTNKKFKFLFVGGTIMRKGIDVLLSAYTEAFTSEDDVCLVIKDMGGNSFYKGQNASEMIEDIKKDPVAPEILYITETLKHEEIAGVYTACDCLVHPYRGEGFGLPVAEAMACGLPVIVTKGGACDDFCSAEYAYLIDSTVRPVHLNNYEFSAPGWLLEPDKSQLIEMLRFVYEQPEKAKEKGTIAARDIKKKVNWEMSADQIGERLKSLKGKPIRRFASSANSPSVQVMKSPQEIYQMIQDSMESQSPEEVINKLEMLVESFPQFALAYNDLGVLHYQAGSKEKAHQFYEKAVQLDPANMVFQKNLADFYYVELGRVEDALRIYLIILETNPEDIETLLITGHICVALEKFQDAEVFYSRVLEIEPGHQDALQYLDKLNSMKTNNSGAKTPEELYREVQPLLNNGDPQRAIGALERLLEKFPDFALAHNDLGVICYHTGNKEKAQQHYERAVEMMPENINFQKNLADFYCLELGRIEEALKIYVDILTTQPQDIETLLATGQICVALEKPGDARDFFNRVLEIEPWNEAARQHLEELERPPSPDNFVNAESPDETYQRLKQNLNTHSQADAINELEKLLGSYPDFALGHNDLGVLYYHNGDKEKTLHHYRQAAQLQPENQTFQKNLADFLFVELGKIEEALQIYVNILAVNPHDVETLLITGHICVALKNFDDARDFYHRVLELEPGNEDAGNNLQELNKHPFGNDLPPSKPTNTFSALTDKVESDDFEPDRSAAGQRAATVSIIISIDGIQNRVKECIKSVMEHTSDPHEILLINRRATKGLLKWAQQLVKENDPYQIIECARQAGWAESLNRAVQKASGEMIVLMHNDVTVPAGWHKAFKMCIDLVPNIGVVGPMSNRTEGIQQIIHSDESDRVEFESAAKAFYEQNQYRRVVTRKLSDFCLAFPRELPDKIGYFDQQFVSEEVVVEDFCKRAASGGYQNLIAADTYVYHYDRHKNKKNASTINSASTADRKKYKEKWNGTQNPEVKALQTVQLLARTEELSQKGKIDAAVEVLLGGIGVQPEDPRFYLALSEILLTAKKFQDAKEALTEMPSADEKQEMRKAQLLAYAEEGLENYEAAQAQIEQVLLMNSGHAPALNLKGILAYRNDDCPSAEKYFKRAIDADPGYGEPYTNLGMLQLEADQQEEALKSFEKGFRLTPTDFDIATNYHTLIAGIAEYQKAENVARDVAFLYPNNQKIKYMLIDFLVQQGKYEMAMPEIEDAIITFGTDNGILSAALKVREKLGPITIQKSLEKVPVSLCMIIKDEEKYLARCLASVKPIVDEMIVVDTGSTDRSKDIAITFGAKVYDYEWKNDFAEARNYSISKASGEWILILDGDEVISPLDHAHFSKMVKKTPRVPIAYSIITRNYNKLANIVGWIPNDGTYLEEEAAIGWLPSEKVRLFYGKDQIWFEGAVHELVDPVLKKNGIEIKKCRLPVHHYGRLDNEKLERKGEIYFDIGKKKLSAMGDDLNALRELAVQATILEKNQEAFELWQRLLSLNPIPNLAAIAYVNMGTIYSRLGKFEDALDAGKKAVKHDPDLKEARYNHAMAELHCGNAPKTIRVLEDLLKGFPDYPPARFILSAAYCCAHQKEKGLEGIRKLRDTPMGTHLDIPCLELAQSLISAGKMEYALWVLGAAIESDIVNPQLLALFKECLNMKDATQNCSHIPQPPQANFQGAIFENLPQ